MNIKKEIGLKIKKLRQKERLTQEQLAEKLGIATRTLAGIEIGESFISAKTIDNIVQYFGMPFEDLVISSHLRSTKELINDIYKYIDNVKDDRDKIESIYKVIKVLASQ